MKVYTGYYGGMRDYKGLVCVAISLGMPKWLKAPMGNIRPLNPPKWMLGLDGDAYVQAYSRLLSKLNPRDIMAAIETESRIHGGGDVVLLCYEKPGDLCHRHIVADWLNKTLGMDVAEYVAPPEPPKEEKDDRQLTLF